jgi:hypothetical protein
LVTRLIVRNSGESQHSTSDRPNGVSDCGLPTGVS